MIRWLHQSWLEAVGQTVTSYTDAARGLTIELAAKDVLVFHNGESLCSFTPTLHAYVPEFKTDVWIGMNFAKDTLVQVVDNHVVTHDIEFSCSWNINITLRVTLAIGTFSTQPWIGVQFASIKHGNQNIESFTLQHTVITVESRIGSDGSTNDNTGSSCPYVNHWQRGLAYKDDTKKKGFGVWYMGTSHTAWTEWSPLRGLVAQDVSSFQRTIQRDTAWSFGNDENVSHVFLFPYSYATVGNDWAAMDAARVSVQNETVIPTPLPEIDQPSQGSGNSDGDGDGDGDAPSGVRSMGPCLLVAVLPLLWLLC